MRALLAFGRNDLRNVTRDTLLGGVLLLPWLVVLGFRLIVPALTRWLGERYGFDLAPYFPLLLSLLCLLNVPLLFGALAGFLILEDRDDDTLTALRVTPVSLAQYAGYRLGAAVLLSAVTVLIAVPLSGLMAPAALPALPGIALVAGLFAPLIALLMVTLAGNKVEGMALVKGTGILMLGPLGAYFVGADWQLLLGVFPTLWQAKAFWVAGEGGAAWPYLAAGGIYHVTLLAWLWRRFERGVYR